ncbi:unnamed protein product, partial [Lymnaea stagnalis]
CLPFTYGYDTCSTPCDCVKENTLSCDAINGTCWCKYGWNGTDCSRDVNECLDRKTSDTCEADDYQICVNFPGGYNCSC